MRGWRGIGAGACGWGGVEPASGAGNRLRIDVVDGYVLKPSMKYVAAERVADPGVPTSGKSHRAGAACGRRFERSRHRLSKEYGGTFSSGWLRV